MKIITQSLIPEILQDFEYYRRKLPMYLQQSECFQEHFKIWYDVLVGSNNNCGIVHNGEILINMLNIFADDYWTFLDTIEESSKTSTTSDILDKLGLLFGVTRNITVTYTYEETTHTNEQLLLTNEELLMLIKAKIIQNYCEGTLQQMNAYYATTGLNIYVNTSESPATANLYLVYYEEQELSNIDKLFLAEQLIIRSMGIKYNTQILIPSTVLIWDQINATNTNGWADNTYIHNINLILQNLATSVNANISITNANANKFTVTDCLLAIESIGGDEGINATGTCIDGFGHRGPISKLQYTSATNTLNITFTDETTGEGTFHWPLSGRYPPTTETINDNVTNMSHEGGNWVI